MSILPKNKSLSLKNYNKERKDISFDFQDMLNIDLFFKQKEIELIQKIEKQNSLNEEDEFIEKYDEHNKKIA